MKVTVLTKARIGFAIALGVPIGAAEFAAFTHIEFLRRNVLLCCLVFGGAGVVCWLTGQFSGVKQVRSSTQGKSVGENPLIFLKSLRYWGIILILSGGSIFSFNSFRNPQPSAVQARPAVDFPELELQGLTLNGAKSSAIINGQVLFIGEGIGSVELIAVSSEQVTVGLGGQTKILSLRK